MTYPPAQTGQWPGQPPQSWQPPQFALPPPKPERPIAPCIAWVAGMNTLWGLCVGLVVGLFFSLLISLFGGTSAEAFDITDPEGGGWVALWVVGIAVASALLGTIASVIALVLLRLGSAYRRFPPFVQALLATLAGYVGSSILGTVLSLVSQLGAVATGAGQ